jgi:5-methylcytosine-specific restriction protein A
MYSTVAWQTLRRNQLMKEPLCARCSERGQVTAATVAHHKLPHKGDPVLFFDPNNLASSCKDCHDVDEQRVERGGRARQGIDPDGWPIGDTSPAK